MHNWFPTSLFAVIHKICNFIQKNIECPYCYKNCLNRYHRDQKNAAIYFIKFHSKTSQKYCSLLVTTISFSFSTMATTHLRTVRLILKTHFRVLVVLSSRCRLPCLTSRLFFSHRLLLLFLLAFPPLPPYYQHCCFSLILIFLIYTLLYFLITYTLPYKLSYFC